MDCSRNTSYKVGEFFDKAECGLLVPKHGEAMLTERASGVLLHLSSLPSRGCIGDLGPAAYAGTTFNTV